MQDFKFKEFILKVFIIEIIVFIIPVIVYFNLPDDYHGNLKSEGLAQNRIIVEGKELTTEQFLLFVMAKDFSFQMTDETLKAFSVAARSSIYARLYSIRQKMNIGEDGDSFIKTEAEALKIDYYTPYEFFYMLKKNNVRGFSKAWESMRKAAEYTYGEYITYKNGDLSDEFRPVDLPWHRASSGFTRNYKGNLSGISDGISVYCPFLNMMKESENTGFPKADIQYFTRRQLLEKFWKYQKTSKVIEKTADLKDVIKIKKRDDSGYVEEAFVGDTSISGEKIRENLGLLSASFYILKGRNEDEIKILTYGEGSGYGISLLGALNLEENGMSYEEILKYYMPGCEIE